ncbi:hypothetical protein GGX14DRAFT_594025 [Mycena pura]|uniref:Uncharacterized protein n=1 Tax=Mycena pura TaxID=153505 RepID=A0AAD6UR70_9AGAR|nr:hypothetical protein GGX14DRAFT_594025 [Mycena pura]
MPPRTISSDLKARIPVLYFDRDFSVKRICSVLGVKKTLVYKTLELHSLHGKPYNPHAKRSSGRRRLLTATDTKYIEIEQSHCIYLDEIQEKLHYGSTILPIVP